MCGRYYRRSDKQRIAEAFRLGRLPADFVLPAWDYNVAPMSSQPVIREDRDTREREMVMMRWGLIPSWCKDVKLLGISTVNAKAESLMLKRMWRTPFKRRRCLVPADGFYESQKVDARTKQPYAFSLKNDEPFAFAGVWERWIAPDQKPVDTFAIITTDPNELTGTVHNRMPVILDPRDYDRWLTRANEEQPPIDLLRPYEAEAMKAWRVDSRVGNVRNNDFGLCAEL